MLVYLRWSALVPNQVDDCYCLNQANSSEQCVSFLRTAFNLKRKTAFFQTFVVRTGLYLSIGFYSDYSQVQRHEPLFQRKTVTFSLLDLMVGNQIKVAIQTIYKLRTLQHIQSVYSCAYTYAIKPVVISNADDILSSLSIKFQFSPEAQQCRAAVSLTFLVEQFQSAGLLEMVF